MLKTIIKMIVWASSVLLAIGFGLLWGYMMCLRNHKLIKGEEDMFKTKVVKE